STPPISSRPSRTRSASRAGTSGRARRSPSSSSRFSRWSSSSSCATCGRSERDGRREESQRPHPVEHLRLRESGAVRLLRAVSRLLYAGDVVQVERRAIQSQVHPVLERERNGLEIV